MLICSFMTRCICGDVWEIESSDVPNIVWSSLPLIVIVYQVRSRGASNRSPSVGGYLFGLLLLRCFFIVVGSWYTKMGLLHLSPTHLLLMVNLVKLIGKVISHILLSLYFNCLRYPSDETLP